MKRFAASWAHELDYNSSETKRRGYSARDLVFFLLLISQLKTRRWKWTCKVEKEGNKEERRRIASMMTICRTATAPGRELSQHFDIPAAARKSIISTKKQFKSFFFFPLSLSLFPPHGICSKSRRDIWTWSKWCEKKRTRTIYTWAQIATFQQQQSKDGYNKPLLRQPRTARIIIMQRDYMVCRAGKSMSTWNHFHGTAAAASLCTQPDYTVNSIYLLGCAVGHPRLVIMHVCTALHNT